MHTKNPFRHTVCAGFIGYIVQAIVNNFAPLLFLTFRSNYGISLDRIALLVTFNFGIQLTVDFLASRFIGRIGYRPAIVAAHFFAGAGLIGLGVLPGLFPEPYLGLLLAVMIYGIGGGLIEVLISPIVEACPTENKPAIMSLLHSFYCWGHVGVVLLSTAFFAWFGIENWWMMATVWAAVSVANGIYFLFVPLRTMEEATGETVKPAKLLHMGRFWMLMLLMLCAGACELSISQWASAFAESALGVTKTVGDLLGPCAFAILMGTSRVIYARFSDRLPLGRYTLFCGILCLIGYLMAAWSVSAVLGLVGCALCGFAVGVMWPGTFSLATQILPGGGTALFALLALAGDMGCSVGPTVVGVVSERFGDQLQVGLLAAVIFPILLIAVLSIREWRLRKEIPIPKKNDKI